MTKSGLMLKFGSNQDCFLPWIIINRSVDDLSIFVQKLFVVLIAKVHSVENADWAVSF